MAVDRSGDAAVKRRRVIHRQFPLLGLEATEEQGVRSLPLRGMEIEGEVLGQAAEGAKNEVLDADRAVGEAAQGLAAGLDGIRRQPRAIDGQIHEKAVLGVLLGLLNQHHLGRDAGLAAVPGPRHGRLAHRFREHVVAEGALVAPVEGFQVDDGGIGRPLALGAQAIVRKALGLDLADMLLDLAGGDPLGEAHPLDAGIIRVQFEDVDIAPPFVPADVEGGVEEADGAPQQLLVIVQAAEDPLGDLLDPVLVPGQGPRLEPGVVEPPEEARHGQGQAQHQIGQGGHEATEGV